jgi:serine/threonine protein kinase
MLGKGSFGDVYLVKDLFPNSGKLYAMKILNKRPKHDENWLRYIQTERDVLASSQSPFIVKLHYAFQTKVKLFLVLDFCPGGDLETMISENKKPFSEDKAKFIIAEILLAIKELHARDVIYRDLKPDNVVIDNKGHMRLIDFGMAKMNINLS